MSPLNGVDTMSFTMYLEYLYDVVVPFLNCIHLLARVYSFLKELCCINGLTVWFILMIDNLLISYSGDEDRVECCQYKSSSSKSALHKSDSFVSMFVCWAWYRKGNIVVKINYFMSVVVKLASWPVPNCNVIVSVNLPWCHRWLKTVGTRG